MNNEGAVVIEDTDFLIDNPWTVDPTGEAGTKTAGGYFNVPNLNTMEEFLAMCRGLNKVRRTIFIHSLYCFKIMKQLPMHLYIGGGAGVDISTVLRVLYEDLVRYMNSFAGTKPDAIKVLLTASGGLRGGGRMSGRPGPESNRGPYKAVTFALSNFLHYIV